MKCEEAFRLVGEPHAGGILVVSDHASNRVPLWEVPWQLGP